MPMDLSCPKCGFVFPVADAAHPVGVECLRCEAQLTAEFRKLPMPAPGQPPYELVVTLGAPAAGSNRSMPADGTIPKRRFADDEGDDRRKKATGSGLGVVVLAALSALVAMLGGLGTAGYFLFSEAGLDTTSYTSRRAGTTPPRNFGSDIRPRVPAPPPVNLTPPGFTPPDFTPPGFALPDFKPPSFTPPDFTPPGFTPPGFTRPNPQPGLTIPDRKPPTPTLPEVPKKVDSFILSPSSPPLPPLRPARVEADGKLEVPLPGKVGQVVVAAGGRYLVMHFPLEGKLATFDVCDGKIVGQADAIEVNCLLAAGVTRAVVYSPVQRKLRAYAIPDLAKLDEAPSVLFHGPRSMAMGHCTDGPLLLIDPFGEVVLQDVEKPGFPEIEGSRGKPGVHSGQARAAAHGRSFSTFDGFGSPHKVIVLTEKGRKWVASKDSAPTPFPTAAGDLFMGLGGAINSAGNSVYLGGAAAPPGTWFVPAATGLYFLKLTPVTSGTGIRAKRTLTVSVHFGRGTNTADNPFPNTLTFEDIPADGLINPFGLPEPLDQRFILVPEAQVLAMVPGTKDRVILRKFVRR
jgi:hypothetical protein